MSAAASKSKTYDLAVLADLCGGSVKSIATTLPWHELRNDGLWVTELPQLPGDRASTVLIEYDDADVWRWHPRAHSGRPALPVPFTARELAAFMLAGGGLFLYERFVSEEGESFQPGKSALAAIGANASEAREVLIEAFRLRRIVSDAFSREDDGVRQAAADLLGDRPHEKANATNLELILNALRAAGIDPKNPPPYKQGTKAPHKQAALKALESQLSRAAINDAWQLGLDAGAIANPVIGLRRRAHQREDDAADPHLPGGETGGEEGSIPEGP